MIEEFSEEDIWAGANYDAKAKQAGLQEMGVMLLQSEDQWKLWKGIVIIT